MAAEVTQAFLDEQARVTREPNKRLLMRLRNVASAGMGAVASSPHTLDADHPPAGAIDDDLTHINYGPAAGADNGIGLSGWKSSDAGVEDDWDTDAERLDDAIAADRVHDMATVFSAGTEVLANTKHNVAIRSEELDNAAWPAINVTVTANTEESPDGTTTAETLDEVAVVGQHGITQTIAKTAGGDIPLSFFVKTGTRFWAYLEAGDGGANNARQYFRISDGSVFSAQITGAGWAVVAGSARIKPVRGRPGTWPWFRIEAIITAPPGATSARIGLFITTNNFLPSYPGVVGGKLFAWGGQMLDDGENPGPYTKTIASPVWAHNQGFENFPPATLLGGQRTWLAGVRTGGAAISSESAIGHSGVRGIKLEAPGPILAEDNVRLPLPIIPSGLVIFQFWASMREAGRTTDHTEFSLDAGAAPLFGLFIDATSGPVGTPDQPQPLRLRIAGGATFLPTDGVIIQDDGWNQFTIVVDRTSPATSDIRVFHRRETGIGVFDPEVHWECWRGTVDTTGLNRFLLHVDNLTPTASPHPIWWFDQLLIHTGHEAESVYAQLLDIGATPTGTAGTITLEAGAEPVRRIVPGASYGFANGDAGFFVRWDATTTAGGFTFTPTTNAQIDSLRVRMKRFGIPRGNVWAQIHSVSGGIPTTNVLARSIGRPVLFDVSAADFDDIIFTFPESFVPDGSSTYALQFVGDWPINGIDYVQYWGDSTAPTYAGGQIFNVAGEPWETPVYTLFSVFDAVFVMYSHHKVLETFDLATIDTDVQLMDVTSIWHLAQGFEVDRTLDFQHLHVAVKALLPGAIGKGALGIWFDLHADDGSGEKPSNTILAEGAIVDPGEMAWATYEWFALRLVTRFALQPGVRYWWVLKGNGNFGPGGGPNGSDMFAFGADDSSPSYSRGNRAYSDDADPSVWTSVPGGAMAFRIMELERPHFQFRANYSEDDITYGAEAVIDGNSARLGDPQASFTGEAAQFWLARAVAVCMGGSAEFGPSATDLTLRAVHAVERELVIDFGQQRQIDMVRLLAHPTEGGLDRLRFETSIDGIGFTRVNDYMDEELESYSQGDPDDKGVTFGFVAGGSFGAWWFEDFNAYPDGEVDGKGPWYRTAAATPNGQLIIDSSAPIEGAKSLRVLHLLGNVTDYGAQFPAGRTQSDYRFSWQETRATQIIGVNRFTKFADLSDSGADAWAIETTSGNPLSDVRVRDALGLSGVVYQQGTALVEFRVEVDADKTLRFYVDDTGGGFVLKYTGLASFRQADRIIMRVTGVTSGVNRYDLMDLQVRASITKSLIPGGEYLGARFASTITASHLKIIVLESGDGFARILEAQAFRVVDIAERVVEMTEEQSASFLLLRMKARTLSLVLKNTDRALSKLNPNGPYFGQLGGGVEFVAYMGYLGAPDMVKQGVFYVDGWGESAAGTEVIIGATDGVKRIDTDVQANHRVNPRHLDIMEYLANLANVPSQFQAIERAAGVVDYFAADRVNAWEEFQKIGEATGGSRVWWDRHGRLRMRLTGTSAAETRMNDLLQSQVPAAVFRRAFGPPVFIGTTMYVAIITVFTDGTGDHEQLKVLAYDTETGIWTFTAGGAPLNSVPEIGFPETGDQHGFAMLATFDDELFALYHYNPMNELGLRISKLTGGNWEIIYDRAGVTFGEHRQEVGGTFFRQVHPRANVRQWLATFGADPTAAEHHRFNMYNMWHVRMTGANNVEGAVTVSQPEGDHAYFSRALTGGDMHFNQMFIERVGGFAGSEVRPMIFLTVIPELHLGATNSTFSMGMTTDGDGNLLTSLVAKTGTMDGQILQQHRTGGTVTKSPVFYDKSDASIQANSRNGLALAISNELVVTGGQRSLPGGPELHLALWDRDANEVVDVGNVSMSNTRMIGFAKTSVQGQDVLFGIVDEGRVIEMYIRRRLPVQAAPVHAITDDIEGAFENAALEGGDDDGESRIINTAIINSNPLTVQPIEKVWEGRRLPWPITWNTKLSFPAKLREAALPFDATDATAQRLTVTFDPPDPFILHTATLSPHHRRPQVTVEITSGPETGGLLTGIEINGKALKKNSSLVGIVVGHKSSFAQFDVRRRTFDNDYIFDNFAQSIMGASVVMRHQFERLRIGGITVRALWHMEMFDLLTLRETERLFVDGVFYVVKFTRAYHGSQRMSLGCEQGIV